MAAPILIQPTREDEIFQAAACPDTRSSSSPSRQASADRLAGRHDGRHARTRRATATTFLQFRSKFRSPTRRAGTDDIRPVTKKGFLVLNGGPCRDRTYDQLIKRSSLDDSFYPYRTISYSSPAVPQFAELPCDKALNSLDLRIFQWHGSASAFPHRSFKPSRSTTSKPRQSFYFSTTLSFCHT